MLRILLFYQKQNVYTSIIILGLKMNGFNEKFLINFSTPLLAANNFSFAFGGKLNGIFNELFNDNKVAKIAQIKSN